MPTEVVKGLMMPFCIALGVVLGGTVIGALSSLVGPESPFYRMERLAEDIKLWAVVVALGGTWPTLQAMDSGLFRGDIVTLARQLAMIMAGFSGAQVGYWIVTTLTGKDPL